MDRREFLGLGIVFASGLGCGAPAPVKAPEGDHDFFFVQLSDTHWGFSGPPSPEAAHLLPDAIDQIAKMTPKPAFVVFTGDLTHKVEDDAERRRRLVDVKTMAAKLGVPVRFIPGEHDAPDGGAAYREIFQETHWTFQHENVHFVGLDNVTDKEGIGAAQLAWLEQEVAKAPKDAPLVVFAHRPLFDLAPDWDWTTADGARAIAILSAHPHVTVFYGHIHQEHEHTTGAIVHRSARSLVFPLPAPMSVPKKAPLPWDAASADHGLGWRVVDAKMSARTVKV